MKMGSCHTSPAISVSSDYVLICIFIGWMPDKIKDVVRKSNASIFCKVSANLRLRAFLCLCYHMCMCVCMCLTAAGSPRIISKSDLLSFAKVDQIQYVHCRCCE